VWLLWLGLIVFTEFMQKAFITDAANIRQRNLGWRLLPVAPFAGSRLRLG